MNKFETLLELLQKSKKTEVLTGAGISTLSGIPDFRGTGAATHQWEGLSLEEIHDFDLFCSKPQYFYGYAKNFIYEFDHKLPNIVHLLLAKMQKKQLVDVIYTQNIDGLHQKAGSVNVEEFHGSIWRNHCLKCGTSYSFEYVKPIVKKDEIPYCEKCHGLIKPDIVFFGEPMDMMQFENAENSLKTADLLLVLGSSLTVYPVAQLPQIAYKSGCNIVIINRDPTPFDSIAKVKCTDLKATFEEISKSFNLED